MVAMAELVCRVERPGARSARREGDFGGLEIADFAEQDDVRVWRNSARSTEGKVRPIFRGPAPIGHVEVVLTGSPMVTQFLSGVASCWSSE